MAVLLRGIRKRPSGGAPTGGAPTVPESQEAAHDEFAPIAVQKLGGPTHWTVGTNQWDGGRVPTTGDRFAISHAMTISSTFAAKCGVVLNGGTLTLGAITATIETLQVLPGGTLVLSDGNTLSLGSGAHNESLDPDQWWQGLNCFGQWTAAGTAKTQKVRTTGAISAGATTLNFASAVSGWLVGDTILIAASNQETPETRPDILGAAYVIKSETRTIATIAGDGLSCTVSALTHAHPAAQDADGTVRKTPYVVNLTRSIKVISTAPAGVRAHTLVSRDGRADITHTEFKDLARTTSDVLNATTNRVGRYAFHFHHLSNNVSALIDGNNFRSVFTDNAVWSDADQTRKWGITVHSTHYCSVKRNNVFGHSGAGIMLETGNETGNQVTHNFVAGSTGQGGRADDRAFGDFGMEGSGIWIRGPFSTIADNVCADCRFGLVLYTLTGGASERTIPTAPGTGGTTVADPARTAMPGFNRNEAYGGRMEAGWVPWSLGLVIRDLEGAAPAQTVIEDLVCWHQWNMGVYSYEVRNVKYLRYLYRGSHAAVTGGYARFGYFPSDYMQADVVFQDCDIHNAGAGIELGVASGGTNSITGGTFCNVINVYLRHMWFVGSPEGIGGRYWTVTGLTCVTHPFAADQYDYYLDSAYQTGVNVNYAQDDELTVLNHNGVADDDLRLYFSSAGRSVIMLATGPNQGGGSIIGCPVSGKTNLQAFTDHGVCTGGTLPPVGAGTRSRFNGLVEDI